MEKHPEIRWNATLETNRGCPYACTFCDWGSLTYNKVKKFNLERVYDELEWIGKNQCDFVSLTDANFGIFPERDSMIADKLIAVQKEYNNPKAYTIAWAKNQKREVVEIVRKLIYEGGSKMGLNLSVQSMDDNVLEIIKRTNLEMNKITEVFEMCEEYNIPLYTTVYQAQLLENAEMNLLQRKLYKLEGQIVYDYLVGTYNEHELKEGIEVIVSTKDLPFDKMVDAQVFSWFMNTFHINGATNYISRFLFKYSNIEYETFYGKLLEHIEKDEWLRNEMERIREHYSNWSKYGRIDHEPIQGMEIHGWNLIHSTLINIHGQDKHDHVFNVIREFMKQFNLPEDIFEELMKFQSTFLIDHKKIQQYPQVLHFEYDILGYIQTNMELNNPSSYEFDFPEDKVMSLQRFCEQIFFARRRNFGKSWITKHGIN